MTDMSGTTVTVEIDLNGVRVPVVFEAHALAALSRAIGATRQPETESEFLTIEEAAHLLRCKRQRIYDLTSSERLPKVKDGTRPLIRRSDLHAYLVGRPNERRGPTPRPTERSSK